VSDRLVEALAKWNFEREWGEGEWQDCQAGAKPGWTKEARETLDFLAAAGFGEVAEAKAQALEEAADVMERVGYRVRYLRTRAADLRGEA